MSVDKCGKCGEPHIIPVGIHAGKPSCEGHVTGGTTRKDEAGRPCHNRPRPGLTKCKYHGGATKNAKAKSERIVTEAKVAKLAARFTDPVPGDDRDPAEIVREQITMQYRLVHWLRARAVAVDPDNGFMWGVTKEKLGGDDGGTTWESKPNAWYVAFVEASDKLNRMCFEAVRVGIELRREQFEARAAELWVTVMDAILSDLGLDPNAPKTAAVVERHLRSVS